MIHPLTTKKMENLNTYYRHPSYYLERKLIQAIRSGLSLKAHEILDQINSLERAKLAATPLRSVKNSLICSCTLFARAAIDANVNPEVAFSLSDLMILDIEKIQEMDSLRRYEYHMADEYIGLVLKAREQNYSPAVTRIIQHINTHINDPLTLSDFCALTGKSKGYLCALFKKELGIPLTAYIQEQKIEEAKNFLLFTDMPIIEISELFGFSNSNYFIKLFRRFYNETPAAFRKKHA